jgi:hypothetical protein
VLRIGTYSICVGIAVVAVALVVKSVGTLAPGEARGGSQAERLGSAALHKFHSDSPTYRALAFSLIPEDAGLRPDDLESEIKAAEGTYSEVSTSFEDRYSFKKPFASFDERFAGVADRARRIAVTAVKTELVLPRYAKAVETELRVFAPEMTGSAAPFAGPRAVAASRVAVAPARVTTSSYSDARPPKVRQVSLSSLSSPDGQNRTAIYDIGAQLVYLPNGRRLEAHSGFGSYMDDPRYVHIRRKGATPPNTYRLQLRERLFHGVQAIRLIPVDAGKMFGRDGILAHHYLLGPNGQSNGCVSFADYPEFLTAFLNGEIDRLVVVERLENPPPGSVIAAGWFEKAFKGLIKTFERGSGT